MAAPHHVFPRLRPWHTGVVLTVVGAAAVLGGLVQTTLSRAGIENCPPGTVLVAKFAYAGDHYVFVGPDVNRNVVTIDSGSAAGGNWHSTVAVSQVIVSGGPGAVMSALAPLQTGSHFSGTGLPKAPSGAPPGVENVQFCFPSPTRTVASTDAPTSSSTEPGPTTGPGGSTSTSFQPASSTASSNTAPSNTAPPNTAAPSTAPAGTVVPTTVVDPLHPSSISNGRLGTATTSAARTSTTRTPTTAAITATTLRPAPPINAPTTTIAVTPVTIARPTTTVKGETTTTTINPVTTGSTIPTTISPNIGSTTSVYFTAASLPAAQLPHHGSPSAMLIWIGIVLAGTGLGVSLVGFRRERGRA